jgi:hypothetical protein
MAAIQVGNTYPTLKDFKTHLLAWSVDSSFQYRIKDSDSRRVRVTCRLETCPFSVRANYYHDKNIAKVTIVNAEHTCGGNLGIRQTMGSLKRGTASRIDWLVSVIPKHFVVEKSLSTKKVVELVEERYGQAIGLQQAQKAKRILLMSPPQGQGGNHSQNQSQDNGHMQGPNQIAQMIPQDRHGDQDAPGEIMASPDHGMGNLYMGLTNTMTPTPRRRRPPPPPPVRILYHARGLFDFTPEEAEELPFKTGDMMEILDDKSGDGWLKARLNGQVGVVPVGWVERCGGAGNPACVCQFGQPAFAQA